MVKFKTGELVQLKSGGPKMTVRRILGSSEDVSFQMIDDYIKKIKGFNDGDVICQWFEGNELKDGAFPKESITKTT